MSRQIRVALFTDSLNPSGVGQVMLTLARQLCRRDYRLLLVCSPASGVDGFVEQMRPHVAEVARLAVRGDEDLDLVEPLVRQLRRWQVDIFHNHVGATWEGGMGTLAARCARVPVVVATEHLPNVLGLAHEVERRRSLNRLLDRLFTVSDSVRQSVLTHRLAPPERVITIENGVEPLELCLRRSDARRELGIPVDRPVILYLGRLVEQKEPATLLQAARLLRASGHPAITLFAGDGSLRQEMDELAGRLDLRGHVRLLGNRTDIPRLFAAADVLALPSRFEGLPLAALEAMSTGLPVVGCDAPGIRDAVKHGVTGWLAPIGDYEELARGLLLALSKEPGGRWAAASRERFARRFMADRMAEEYHRAYSGSMAGLTSAARTVERPLRIRAEGDVSRLNGHASGNGPLKAPGRGKERVRLLAAGAASGEPS